MFLVVSFIVPLCLLTTGNIASAVEISVGVSEGNKELDRIYDPMAIKGALLVASASSEWYFEETGWIAGDPPIHLRDYYYSKSFGAAA